MSFFSKKSEPKVDDITSLHLEALNTAGDPVARIPTVVADKLDQLKALADHQAADRADHLRDLLVRSTVTIVRTMMETKNLPETSYDADTKTTTYIADPIEAAIRSVYKTLAEVSA